MIKPVTGTASVVPLGITQISPHPITPTPTLDVPLSTHIPSVWKPKPVSSYQVLENFCKQQIYNSMDWIQALDQLQFSSNLSLIAQNSLPFPVAIHPTCNFSLENQPKAIVLHYTEGDRKATITTFQQPHNSSAHYIIDRDGSVTQLVPEELAAFHVTCYGNRSLCVSSCPICNGVDGEFIEPRTMSIGIELVNQGHINPQFFRGAIFEDYSMSFGYRDWEDFTEEQITSLKVLVEDIRQRWNIPWEMIIGHSRINTNTDPGPALNLFGPRNGNPPRMALFEKTIPN